MAQSNQNPRRRRANSQPPAPGIVHLDAGQSAQVGGAALVVSAVGGGRATVVVDGTQHAVRDGYAAIIGPSNGAPRTVRSDGPAAVSVSIP